MEQTRGARGRGTGEVSLTSGITSATGWVGTESYRLSSSCASKCWTPGGRSCIRNRRPVQDQGGSRWMCRGPPWEKPEGLKPECDWIINITWAIPELGGVCWKGIRLNFRPEQNKAWSKKFIIEKKVIFFVRCTSVKLKKRKLHFWATVFMIVNCLFPVKIVSVMKFQIQGRMGERYVWK